MDARLDGFGDFIGADVRLPDMAPAPGMEGCGAEAFSMDAFLLLAFSALLPAFSADAADFLAFLASFLLSVLPAEVVFAAVEWVLLAVVAAFFFFLWEAKAGPTRTEQARTDVKE